MNFENMLFERNQFKMIIYCMIPFIVYEMSKTGKSIVRQ